MDVTTYFWAHWAGATIQRHHPQPFWVGPDLAKAGPIERVGNGKLRVIHDHPNHLHGIELLVWTQHGYDNSYLGSMVYHNQQVPSTPFLFLGRLSISQH